MMTSTDVQVCWQLRHMIYFSITEFNDRKDIPIISDPYTSPFISSLYQQLLFQVHCHLGGMGVVTQGGVYSILQTLTNWFLVIQIF